MNLSFYVEHGNGYYVAWRSIQAPKEECGRGPTPEAAIIALLLNYPTQAGRAVISLEEQRALLDDLDTAIQLWLETAQIPDFGSFPAHLRRGVVCFQDDKWQLCHNWQAGLVQRRQTLQEPYADIPGLAQAIQRFSKPEDTPFHR